MDQMHGDESILRPARSDCGHSPYGSQQGQEQARTRRVPVSRLKKRRARSPLWAPPPGIPLFPKANVLSFGAQMSPHSSYLPYALAMSELQDRYETHTEMGSSCSHSRTDSLPLRLASIGIVIC
ncbi:hypothetical protein GCM10023320_80870 [Pseudonocardia adelaidensis]|uniref:Uncharacterized protein n=1 Tax=Pseudonocardia adelaidensis TaxID=648754 RepID=A0ABP9P6T3_9PSEU